MMHQLHINITIAKYPLKVVVVSLFKAGIPSSFLCTEIISSIFDNRAVSPQNIFVSNVIMQSSV